MEDTEGLRLTIRREEHVEDPRKDFDHAATMVCWHRRYNLGDEQPDLDPQEWFEDLPEGTITLPLYLYDHGGITMSTGAFGCPWDSGQVGWIYLEPDTIRSEYNLEPGAPITDEIRDKAIAMLQAEVREYDQYLTGDIWYYVLERAETCDGCHHTEWEHVDSLGDIYASEKDSDMVAHLREHIPEEAHHLIEEAWANRE